MMYRLLILFSVQSFVVNSAVAFCQTLDIAALPEGTTASYSRHIAPVLNKNCLACHNASNAEGGVNLETVKSMQSSEVESILVAGQPEESLLFQLASHTHEPVMPPEDNDVSASSLSPMELALLKNWIASGAQVDLANETVTNYVRNPLPETIQTTYGVSLTSDGRLLAASFGNQIRLFGASSNLPIDTLVRRRKRMVSPAHDDFVQDLVMDRSGQRIISAGFRNVKFWQLAPFQPATVPPFNSNNMLCCALSFSGNQIGVLFPDGEVRVAKTGDDRWYWKKKIDLNDSEHNVEQPSVRMALSDSGNSVVIASKTTLWVAESKIEDVRQFENSSDMTALMLLDEETIVVGDKSGTVTFWNREEDGWKPAQLAALKNPVKALLPCSHHSTKLIAVGSSGEIAGWSPDSLFVAYGKLSAPVVSATVTQADEDILVALEGGAIGRYSITKKQYSEIASKDPSAQLHHRSSEWQSEVSEKLVETISKEKQQADKATEAEKKNQEALTKDFEAKQKAQEEKAKLVEDARQATVKAAARLVAVQEQQQDVKAGKLAAKKANKNLDTKQSELAEATRQRKQAQKALAAGQTRLKSLEAEGKQWALKLADAKTLQEEATSKHQTTSQVLDQSQTADHVISFSTNGYFMTHSAAMNTWHLWSDAGDWVATLSDFNHTDELIAVGSGCVVVAKEDGNVMAFRPVQTAWQHSKSIGSISGNSPFADRVLCLDVNPAGQLLATGGGRPSRSGELVIWNTSDGSLVRDFPSPHSDTILSVRFSPDGKTLASTSADRLIKLWDVETGMLKKTLEGHTHHVSCIAWNVNGRELATGSADATVKIWNIESGQAVQTISGFKAEVTQLDYVGADDRIGLISGDRTFQIYRTDNGKREIRTELDDDYLYSLAADVKGTHFVVGGQRGTVTRLDQTGKQISQMQNTSN